MNNFILIFIFLLTDISFEYQNFIIRIDDFFFTILILIPILILIFSINLKIIFIRTIFLLLIINFIYFPMLFHFNLSIFIIILFYFVQNIIHALIYLVIFKDLYSFIFIHSIPKNINKPIPI